MGVVLWLAMVALTVVTVIDIVKRDDGQIRFMPKVVWLILVILLPLVGIVLWFVLGREYPDGPVRVSRPRPAARPAPATPAPPARPYDSRSTEQQLADLEREIEEERLRAELRRRKGGGGDQSSVG